MTAVTTIARTRLLGCDMRWCLALLFVPAVLPQLACVSHEAVRRVQVTSVRAALSCRLVREVLKGQAERVDDALEHLRTRAARNGANYVVVTAGPKKGWDVVGMKMRPWPRGAMQEVSGDAFFCPEAPMTVTAPGD